MDRFTLQPGAGSAAIFTNVAIIRAYHEPAAKAEQRDEIITTIFSHPSNAAARQGRGLQDHHALPGRRRLPRLEALQGRRLGPDRRAAHHQPRGHRHLQPAHRGVRRLVHAAGGLCSTTRPTPTASWASPGRARRASTCATSTCTRPSRPRTAAAAGRRRAAASRRSWRPSCPCPTVEFDGTAYYLDYDRPQSIGKIRAWYGVTANMLKAYAWIMSLGADGLREVAEIAVLNNNYLLNKVLEIRGASAPYATGQTPHRAGALLLGEAYRRHRRPSEDIGFRAADFGIHYWTSHHPFVVPEPMTLEPTESYSRRRPRRIHRHPQAHCERGLYESRDRQHRAAQQHRPQDRPGIVR